MKIIFALLFLISQPLFGQGLGINLNSVTDYNPEIPFIDLIKSSRCFGSPDKTFDCKFGDKIPNENFGVFVYTDLPNLNGTYKISYNGKSDLGATGTIQNFNYDPGANKTTAEILMGSQAMSVKFTNITSPISNLSILRPGFSEPGVIDRALIWIGLKSAPLFNPLFLESLKAYSTIRFMDWLRMNSNPIKTWADRKLPTDLLQTGVRGVSLEYVVALGNELNKDIYVNVPWQADLDYEKQMASLIKSNLKSSLKVYVEYSNEVWNTAPGFTGTAHKDLAVAEVAAGAKDLQLDNPADTNEWYWARRRVGKKTVEISKAFREVFGDDAMGDRVRIVLGAHAADHSKARVALDYINHYSPPVSKHIWGLAIAPYFATADHLVKNASNVPISVKPDATIETVLSGCQNSINTNAASWVSRKAWDGKSQDVNHREYADYYGIKLLFYESGHHLNNVLGASLVKSTKLDPRFQEMYKNYFMKFFNSNPGGLAFQFSDISTWKTGNEFGATYDLKVDTPQTLALKDVGFLASQPKPPVDSRDQEIVDLKAKLVASQAQATDLTSKLQIASQDLLKSQNESRACGDARGKLELKLDGVKSIVNN